MKGLRTSATLRSPKDVNQMKDPAQFCSTDRTENHCHIPISKEPLTVKRTLSSFEKLHLLLRGPSLSILYREERRLSYANRLMLFIVHSVIKIFTGQRSCAFDYKQMFHLLTAHLTNDPSNHPVMLLLHTQINSSWVRKSYWWCFREGEVRKFGLRK